MIKSTPKSLRLQIGLFGRTNVGKSSFLNMMAGQDVAITSPRPGTTTDVVEKAMELLPLGPVMFLDTGGLDDTSSLGTARVERAQKAFHRADVICLVIEPRGFGPFEEDVCRRAREENTPLIMIVNKADWGAPSQEFLETLAVHTRYHMVVSATDTAGREAYVNEFKRLLLKTCPEEFLRPPALIGDLLPPGGLAVLIVPIDLQAPKGRLILPQVQTIRDALDNDAAAVVVKEREYAHFLNTIKRPPDLVVCDSQIVLKMVADTPLDVKCTTFSTLFARLKGDLTEMVRGAVAVNSLKAGDRVLIAEACSHHALEDDIGRVKIPRWVRQFAGCDLDVDMYTGRDFPDNLAEYRLVIHCGACMLTRREMLWRIEQVRRAGVPVTNYGVCISFVQGVLERILSPFPAALDAYRHYQTASAAS